MAWEAAMRVSVGPAKRLGDRKVIYDKVIEASEVDTKGDRATLTICAKGVYGKWALLVRDTTNPGRSAIVGAD